MNRVRASATGWYLAGLLTFAGLHASADPQPQRELARRALVDGLRRAPSREPALLVASPCSESCDQHASDCVDACENQFKDDKARVRCKLTCVAEREKCATACH